jgi:hypothetical protein
MEITLSVGACLPCTPIDVGAGVCVRTVRIAAVHAAWRAVDRPRRRDRQRVSGLLSNEREVRRLVGPKLLAGHFAGGEVLDERAVLERHALPTRGHLCHQRGGNLQMAGESGTTPTAA